MSDKNDNMFKPMDHKPPQFPIFENAIKTLFMANLSVKKIQFNSLWETLQSI